MSSRVHLSGLASTVEVRFAGADDVDDPAASLIGEAPVSPAYTRGVPLTHFVSDGESLEGSEERFARLGRLGNIMTRTGAEPTNEDLAAALKKAFGSRAPGLRCGPTRAAAVALLRQGLLGEVDVD